MLKFPGRAGAGDVIGHLAIVVAAIVAFSWPGLALGQEAPPDASQAAVEGAVGSAGQQKEGINPRITEPGISTAELSFLLIPLTKGELEDVGRDWLTIVRTRTQEIADLQAERARSPGKSDDDIIARIVSLVEVRARVLERFTLVTDSLERKGGDPDLVAELRAYRQAILFEETSQASFKALAGSFVAWMGRADGGIALLVRLGIVGLALLALVFAARILRSLLRFWIGRSTRISKLLQGFIVGALYWVFIVIGLAIVLSSVDVDITPMFAVIGGASFILAFAFQDTLGNLASGLMIMINQPFDEGDFIEIGGVGGTVKRVNMVGTTIATPDNRIIVVPNKNVWGNVIVNTTASDIRRVDLVFSASYGDPIQLVLDTIGAEVGGHPSVLSEPKADIRANALGANSVNFVCRPWVKSEDYWDVYCDLTRSVKEAFDRHGLTMPFQQQDLHLVSVPDQISGSGKI